MRPLTLPLVTDFKKEYKFLWYIQGVQDIAPSLTLDGDTTSAAMYTASLGNIIYCGYVSQLAENVDLPDDEFETEQIPDGPFTWEMPKRTKMGNITVTYLDDSLNSVYNFHKAWKTAIGGYGYNINTPNQLYATAKYIEFENTMTATEYATLKNAVMEYANSAISSYLPNLDLSSKPTSITTYPKIYPTKINRTPANHSGTGLAKVTVTYARLPKLELDPCGLYQKDSLGYVAVGKWNKNTFGY